ncbi:MAG: 2-hydroxychromene-2-carboxylate isomerase [Pseudomonadota bacterium]
MDIDFYFDFGSPAAYLAWTQLGRIEAESGAKVRKIPMLLGGVFKATGNATPVSVPAKGAWMTKDLARHAARYGAPPLKMPPGFPINTLHLMRGAAALEGDERFDDYLSAIYGAMFERGENMADPAEIGRALTEAGFDAKAIFAMVEDQAVKDRLKANTEEAVARGAFGAPTFFVGDEMHFGQDRIEWVIEAAKR